MQTNKLDQIADRQIVSTFRDYTFGAFMAVVVGLMLLALVSTSKTHLPTPAGEVVEAPSLADEIEAHTAAACGDLDTPAPPTAHLDLC